MDDNQDNSGSFPTTPGELRLWLKILGIETVEESRRQIAEGLGRCPSCDRPCKARPRSLRPWWLALLRRILRDYGVNKPVHVYKAYPFVKVQSNSNDWAGIEYFELAATSFYDGPEKIKTHSAEWYATDLGAAFCRNEVRVPSFKVIHLGKVIGESKDLVSFDEVMRWPWKFDLRTIYPFDEAEIGAKQWNTGKPRKRRAA